MTNSMKKEIDDFSKEVIALAKHYYSLPRARETASSTITTIGEWKKIIMTCPYCHITTNGEHEEDCTLHQ